MKRILFLIMTLFFLHGCATGVAAGYGQGGRNADGRSYQEAQADNRISAKVNSVLVREHLDVNVQTRDGVVTLSGRVANQEQARRAVELAQGIPGVSEVRNQLRIAR